MSVNLDLKNDWNDNDVKNVVAQPDTPPRLFEEIIKNALDEIDKRPMLHSTRPQKSIKRLQNWLQTWHWFTEADVKGRHITLDFCCEVLDKDARNVRRWIWFVYETQMQWCEAQLAELLKQKARETILKRARWKAARQSRVRILKKLSDNSSTTKNAIKR